MKKVLILIAAAIGLTWTAGCLTGCRQKTAETAGGVCRIHGTISQQYNDKRIFLVPLTGPKTAEYVDSIEVKDGHFEFQSDTLMLAQILMDYHYRLGLQPLLVVVEPGDVSVSIDSISHSTGTLQNDSLEQWKTLTEAYRMQLAALRQRGDKARTDSLQLAYKQATRRMAKNLEGTLIGQFLAERFPLTYKRQLPDGRTVTINADTQEEIR